ncbi:plasma kallikrein-like [Protopterus annectens]|uniref:plasma kallikrein-like n=1 Tax=Protopterus annectens TaxID=7888 RepID=UPI001CFB6231|nr:plasma kallikrein-like [Protopterus annectens]
MLSCFNMRSIVLFLLIVTEWCQPAHLKISSGCSQGLLHNFNFPGHDFLQILSPDAGYCQLLCTYHPKCQAFTFVTKEWDADNRKFFCYLKRSELENPWNETSLQNVISGFTLKSCSSFPKSCYPDIFNDINFFGSDYKSLSMTDYKLCQKACTNDPNCQFFTYVKPDYHDQQLRTTCFLKKIENIIPPIGECLAENVYFNDIYYLEFLGNTMNIVDGSDHRSTKTECSGNPVCEFFTAKTEKHQQNCRCSCEVKSSPGPLPAPKIINKLDKVVSGFSLRNC